MAENTYELSVQTKRCDCTI